MPDINDEAYNAGKKDFKRGTTIREMIVKTSPPKGQQPDGFDYAKAESDAFSRIVGFGDAFLEFMRGGMRR